MYFFNPIRARALAVSIVMLFEASISGAHAVEPVAQVFFVNRPMSVVDFETQVQSFASTLEFVVIDVETNIPGSYQTFGSVGVALTLDQVISESLITIQDMRNTEGTNAKHANSAYRASYDAIERNLKGRKFVISFARGRSKDAFSSQLPYSRKPSGQSRNTSSNPMAPAIQLTSSSCGIWRPNFHSNLSAPSSFAGQRYNTLKFAFTQGQLDQFACTESTGFEPDFITYNYDNAYYFESIVLSFSTNMPYGYLDTNFDDGPEKRVYTVGTSKASSLKPWTEYNTYFRTGNGNANSDLAKITWQRNSERVAGCSNIFGPAWCLFADDYVKIYPFQIPVPGYFEG